MQEIYRFIDDAIEADRQRYTDIADQIWDHPETRFEEFWSAEHLASALESAGFTVTRNVAISQMPLLLRLVKANRLSPCWENMTPWQV